MKYIKLFENFNDNPERTNENLGSAFSTILNMRLQDGDKSIDSDSSDYKPLNFQEEIKSLKIRYSKEYLLYHDMW